MKDDLLEGDAERLMHVIDRDRYIVAAGIQRIEQAIHSRRWVLEGRGPYTYEQDEEYRAEFSQWLDDVAEALQPFRRVAWDKSDCTRIEERVVAAKEAAKDILKQPLGPRRMIAADIFDPTHALARKAAMADELAEALELALEYWAHRQQRYKNRSPVWVVDARQALAKWSNHDADKA